MISPTPLKKVCLVDKIWDTFKTFTFKHNTTIYVYRPKYENSTRKIIIAILFYKSHCNIHLCRIYLWTDEEIIWNFARLFTFLLFFLTNLFPVLEQCVYNSAPISVVNSPFPASLQHFFTCLTCILIQCKFISRLTPCKLKCL